MSFWSLTKGFIPTICRWYVCLIINKRCFESFICFDAKSCSVACEKGYTPIIPMLCFVKTDRFNLLLVWTFSSVGVYNGQTRLVWIRLGCRQTRARLRVRTDLCASTISPWVSFPSCRMLLLLFFFLCQLFIQFNWIQTNRSGK